MLTRRLFLVTTKAPCALLRTLLTTKSPITLQCVTSSSVSALKSSGSRCFMSRLLNSLQIFLPRLSLKLSIPALLSLCWVTPPLQLSLLSMRILRRVVFASAECVCVCLALHSSVFSPDHQRALIQSGHKQRKWPRQLGSVCLPQVSCSRCTSKLKLDVFFNFLTRLLAHRHKPKGCRQLQVLH